MTSDTSLRKQLGEKNCGSEKNRRMEELREEIGVKERFRRKLVRSRLTGTGHVERI